MAGHTAIVVVHGIGAQEPGETLQKLVRGLRLADRDFAPRTDATGMSASVGGHPVRLYEVYWADLLRGDVIRGTFLMNELQSLSWFPLLNQRRGNYRSRPYFLGKVAWWCVTLPIANFLALFAYYGAALFVPIFSGEAFRRGRDLRNQTPPVPASEAGVAASVGVVDRILDEYVGDLVNYVNSAGNAFYREKDEAPVAAEVAEVFPRILQRFHDQLLRAHADGCDTIQVVAHSLGSVVAYHALSGFGDASQAAGAEAIHAAKAQVSRFYTIGCPLEKIRFFWPRVAPVPVTRRASNLQWDNFVSLFDPVSGWLKTFEDWGAVNNHRLVGGGFILGHVVYEHSPVFLGALTEGICGRRLPIARTVRQRLWDGLVLFGETLFAPTLALLILGAGAALFTVGAFVVPYAASWLVRWFVPAETWAPIVDTASYVLLGMMILAFLVAPAVRASRAHSMYWVGKE